MSNVTITRPQRRRPRFHPLRVAKVERLTDEAVAVTFEVPDDLRDEFSFLAGQHLTVRRLVPPEPGSADGTATGGTDGTATGETDVRRSYSICSTPSLLAAQGLLRVGIKQVSGGAFSTFANADLVEGDVVDVLPPLGHFTTAFDPDRSRRYAAIVAGSGITPVLSLVATALEIEPASTFTLLYGNRYARSVMFSEELADLKDRYPTRLQVVHVLSREPQDAELLSGRLDSERLALLLDALLPPSTVDEWFLCGPYRLVLGAQEVLAAQGVPDRSVHVELFHVEGEPVERRTEEQTGDGDNVADVTIVLDGRTSSFQMRRDDRVLDQALKVRPELPYACKGGVCSTCRAKLVSGEIRMAQNWALEPDELAAGYVLTCQSSPVTDAVVVDYDA